MALTVVLAPVLMTLHYTPGPGDETACGIGDGPAQPDIVVEHDVLRFFCSWPSARRCPACFIVLVSLAVDLYEVAVA